MKQLIIGGARSGKSRLAEQLAEQSGKTVIYIATSDSRLNDAEMDNRIERHQKQRPEHWQTVECPIELAQQLQLHAAEQHCLLVDCLTLWLSNCLFNEHSHWPDQQQQLLDHLAGLAGDVIFVGNEVGSGIVPLGESNRRFVDEMGFLHQAIASQCDRVIFTAAGLPLVMKGAAL
jgi:adenosylcobinamide kinase/adenosylcobinamide-phosphate guanylyltransferase